MVVYPVRPLKSFLKSFFSLDEMPVADNFCMFDLDEFHSWCPLKFLNYLARLTSLINFLNCQSLYFGNKNQNKPLAPDPSCWSHL